MTVRELFECLDAMSRRISIRDWDFELVYEKPEKYPLTKMNCWDREVAWIHHITGTRIDIDLAREPDPDDENEDDLDDPLFY